MLLGATFATVLLAAAPAGPCAPEPRLDLAVLVEHYPPAVQSSYSLGELRDLAARSGSQTRHAPLGFYAGSFGYTIEVTVGPSRAAGCRPDIAVVVRLILADRLVELGTDLPCRADTVLSHYMLHAAQDDRLLSLYAGRVRAALDQTPTEDLVRGAVQGNVKAAVTEAVRHVVDGQLRPYSEERTQALVSVDTDAEVARLGGLCGREL